MRRYPYKKYLLIVFALFVVLSLPTFFVRGMRHRVFALFSPAIRAGSYTDPELERLTVENRLLRSELEKVRKEQAGELKAIAGHVIYRDPGSWSSSVWIDVGARTDPMIQKNCPVVVGRALIGVIDEVRGKQSRVRLITDVALKPAVRAVRGASQNHHLAEQVKPLLSQLEGRTDLPLTKEEQGALARSLTEFKRRLEGDTVEWYLAKGIVQGAGTPLWRSINSTLRGIGFNYDFPDEKGPARELATGKPIDSTTYPTLPIIQENDLLVTTGMDGVFPEGLLVAEVSKVFPLREGAYTYELEAVPVAGSLDTLQTLFVIPKVGYDPDDESD